jgi:hypothetical protein
MPATLQQHRPLYPTFWRIKFSPANWIWSGLHEANPTEAISKEDIDEEIGKILNRFEPLYEEVKVLKRQRKYILEILKMT